MEPQIVQQGEMAAKGAHDLSHQISGYFVFIERFV
jgi:hypothetical protein